MGVSYLLPVHTKLDRVRYDTYDSGIIIPYAVARVWVSGYGRPELKVLECHVQRSLDGNLRGRRWRISGMDVDRTYCL